MTEAKWINNVKTHTLQSSERLTIHLDFKTETQFDEISKHNRRMAFTIHIYCLKKSHVFFDVQVTVAFHSLSDFTLT